MINNFASVCGDLNARIERTTIKMTEKHNRTVAKHEAVCEELLSAMGDKPMRVKELAEQFPVSYWPYTKYTCQKVTAMMRKLVALGIVQRVLIEEKEIEINDGLWIPKEVKSVVVDGEIYTREIPGHWDDTPVKKMTKIYGYVKIGA
jgi:hypothetical protein